jgi:hypothetical protein
LSDTKKAPQQAREGIEQVRTAATAAVDSTVRTAKEAVGRAENVFNRAADQAQATGTGLADTMARGAEAATDISERAAEQGRDMISFGLRIAAGVNSRIADTTYDRGHHVLETTARALDIYREAAASSAEKMQALFTSWTQLGRGIQQMQVAYLQLLNRTLKDASHKPQDLLRAKSAEEVARIQRDLYLDAVNYAVEASSTLLQIAGRVAQEAVPTPKSHSLVVAAR